MNILHIDSSIHQATSVSRELSRSLVEHLRAGDADVEVTYRDLAAFPIPHLSGRTFEARATPSPSIDTALAEDLALGDTLVNEYLQADIVVIGIGFYNFSIPSQLKAWVDRIVVMGKTFSYSDEGPVGLVGKKRMILAIARGGFYGPDTPMASFEHAESYLRSVFSLLGVPELEVIAAEGVARGPETRAASLQNAHALIDQLQTA